MKYKIIFTFFVIIGAIILALGYYNHSRNQQPPIQSIEPREEINITIIPGWNLRQIAADWKDKGIIKDEDELYKRLGKPAYNYAAFGISAPTLNYSDSYGKELYPLLKYKPKYVSYEGFIFPDTYRIYKDAELSDVLHKVFTNLENKFTDEMRVEMNKQQKNVFEILTMAALVEREANNEEDMKLVADIFWRRHQQKWALQSCASVNYVTGKKTPAISAEDQELDTPYNTYKYAGLPLGPVGNPSLTAIKATLYPKKNSYWYFMTGNDGVMRYGVTLDQHNANVYNYLR